MMAQHNGTVRQATGEGGKGGKHLKCCVLLPPSKHIKGAVENQAQNDLPSKREGSVTAAREVIRV